MKIKLSDYTQLSKEIEHKRKIVKKMETIIMNQDLSLITWEAQLLRLKLLKEAREEHSLLKEKLNIMLDDAPIPAPWRETK